MSDELYGVPPAGWLEDVTNATTYRMAFGGQISYHWTVQSWNYADQESADSDDGKSYIECPLPDEGSGNFKLVRKGHYAVHVLAGRIPVDRYGLTRFEHEILQFANTGLTASRTVRRIPLPWPLQTAQVYLSRPEVVAALRQPAPRPVDDGSAARVAVGFVGSPIPGFVKG
jgi:hypothetical protein